MLNIAVLVSGGGTNLQALLDSETRGENPNGKITLVVASKPGVFALERAAKAGVEGCVVRRKNTPPARNLMLHCWKHCGRTRLIWWCWRAFCPCWAPASLRPIRAVS